MKYDLYLQMAGVNISGVSPKVIDNILTTTPFYGMQVGCPNGTKEVPSTLEEDYFVIRRTLTPIIYTLGFPGNILSFLIWIRPKMRHSSGVYLAALALADFVFLVLHLMFELQLIWQVKVINFPVICEAFTIVFLTFQCLAPLLVLAFTVERYISVCHPFKGVKFCTQRRAKIVSLALAVGSLAICAIQGYFWTYGKAGCAIRPEVLEGGNSSFWNVWSWATDLLFFLVVPMAVLLFNILVIRETKRLSKYQQTQLHGRQQKTSATTVMLLAVSFYLICATLPVTVVYVTVLNFQQGPACVVQDEDPTWRQYWHYILVRAVVEEIGITHFALNFYIYMIVGKQFRKEFKNMVMSMCGKTLSEAVRTEYTTITHSFRGSMKKDMTVRLSTNGTTTSNDKEVNGGGETKL